MYIMAQGLTNITQYKTRTGIIPDAMKDFNQTKGLIGKLYGFSQKASLAPDPITRGLGVVAHIASTTRTDAVKAADNMLASPEFRTAVLSTNKGPKVAKIAEARLKKTEAFKNYIRESDNKALNRWKSQLTTGTAVSAGPSFIGWLMNGEEE